MGNGLWKRLLRWLSWADPGGGQRAVPTRGFGVSGSLPEGFACQQISEQMGKEGPGASSGATLSRFWVCVGMQFARAILFSWRILLACSPAIHLSWAFILVNYVNVNENCSIELYESLHLQRCLGGIHFFFGTMDCKLHVSRKLKF